MRTALLSAVAALVLTSTYSVSSFAQHDDDTYLAWAVRYGHKVVASNRPNLLFFPTRRIGADRDGRDR
jgi:hypothetical protein